LLAVKSHITVFYVMTPCSVMGDYQHWDWMLVPLPHGMVSRPQYWPCLAVFHEWDWYVCLVAKMLTEKNNQIFIASC
jgi:hypothetical protein